MQFYVLLWIARRRLHRVKHSEVRVSASKPSHGGHRTERYRRMRRKSMYLLHVCVCVCVLLCASSKLLDMIQTVSRSVQTFHYTVPRAVRLIPRTGFSSRGSDRLFWEAVDGYGGWVLNCVPALLPDQKVAYLFSSRAWSPSEFHFPLWFTIQNLSFP